MYPHTIQPRHGHDLGRRSNVDTFAYAEMGDNAIGIGIYANSLARLLVLLQPVDFTLSDTKGDEPVPRCAEQNLIVAAQRCQVFLLCIDQGR